jgi:peptidoglycan/LPS O-acetylase OafA/YrhL
MATLGKRHSTFAGGATRPSRVAHAVAVGDAGSREAASVNERLPQRTFGYEPALDGLRGIAVALVVSFHAFGIPRDGFLGVDLFFVLSGFLITSLLLGEQELRGRISLSGFYVRRALRLLPALFAFLAVSFAVQIIAAGVRHDLARAVVLDLVRDGAVAAFYVSNFVLAGGGVDALPAGLSHLWSLAAEEQFYLLWPVLLVCGLARHRRWAGIVLMAAIAVVALRQFQLVLSGVPSHRLGFGPDTRSGSILIGCLFALLRANEHGARRLASFARVALPFALVLAYVIAVANLGRTLFGGPLTLFGLCAAVIIVAVLDERCVLRRWLSQRPLVYLGRLSYSLYLWHLPIFTALGVALVGASGAAGAPRAAAAVAASLVAAALSYHFVETPFLRRKRQRQTPELATHRARTTPVPNARAATEAVT